jgi:hypothetical protein
VDSHRLRALRLVVAELQTLPGIGQVLLGRRLWSKLPSEAFPCACVVAGSGGDAEATFGAEVAVDLPILVHGAVFPPGPLGADGLLEAREAFYQLVENALLGNGLQARLDADLLVHGQRGAIVTRLGEGPAVDEAEQDDLVPAGMATFTARVLARLHYDRGAL